MVEGFTGDTLTNPILEVVTLRVCVCGGRDYDDIPAFVVFMERLFLPRVNKDNLIIVQGGAKGADTLAKDWAKFHEIDCETFMANWSAFGKSAWIKRNKAMLDSGLDFCIAFGGGRGTYNMMDICRDAGVPNLTEHNIDMYLPEPPK